MRTLPSEILLDFTLPGRELLADSLTELAGRRVNIQSKPRGDRARYLKLARTNAGSALKTRLSQHSTIHQRLTALAEFLKLEKIGRMECFDISHTMGEQTIASCVVFDQNGPLRADYRRYNITGITPGDDYAAMNQVLRRRYGKAIEEEKIPDVILIDGGKGQLAQAKQVFAELDVPWINPAPFCWALQRALIVKPVWKPYFSSQKARAFLCHPMRQRFMSFSIFVMTLTIMQFQGTVKNGPKSKHQRTGKYRGRGTKTATAVAQVHGRPATVDECVGRGDRQCARYIACAGGKNLLLVETLALKQGGQCRNIR